jgi:hypothetical protein
MTTNERNQIYSTAAEGSLIYNSDSKKFEYKGSIYWFDLVSNTKFVDLTYPGATHTKNECLVAGGVPVDVVEGISTYSLCRFSGSNISVPVGWTQAGYWQTYDVAQWGSTDLCGRHISTGPIVWSNVSAAENSPGASTTAWGCSHPFAVGIWHTAFGAYSVNTIVNPSNHRIEVGAK